VGSAEGGGGTALAVGGDQVGDVTLIEAVAHALRTLCARSRWQRQGWRAPRCGKVAGQRLVQSASKRPVPQPSTPGFLTRAFMVLRVRVPSLTGKGLAIGEDFFVKITLGCTSLPQPRSRSAVMAVP
jgi:hypothetical protein